MPNQKRKQKKESVDSFSMDFIVHQNDLCNASMWYMYLTQL